MAITPRTQIPLKLEFLGRDQKVSQPWAFWFDTLNSSLPKPGTGFVVDGTAGITGPTTIYQGPASGRGVNPAVNSVYIADDTGQVFTVAAGQWQEQSGALTGDITKPAHSHVTTLVTVNADPGTYGSGTLIPIITVDAKGRVTSTSFAPVQMPPLPGGVGDFIYKADAAGNPGATTLYNRDTYTVTRKIVFHQEDATPILMFALNGNSVVTKVELVILDAFDGIAPTISVGTDGVFNDLMDTTDNNPMLLSIWTVEPGTKYATPQSIFVSISADGGSTGYALINISTTQL